MSKRKSYSRYSSVSITDETVEQYRKVSDSLAGLITDYDLRARDFVLLSYSCDQGPMEIDQLASILTLSRSTTLDCTSRLEKSGLIRQQTSTNDPNVLLISVTESGMDFIRKLDKTS